MEVDAAREYHVLSEKHKEIIRKHKQFLAKLENSQGREKCARYMASMKETELYMYQSLAHLKQKYAPSKPSPKEVYRSALEDRIKLAEENVTILQRMTQLIHGTAVNTSPLFVTLTNCQISLDQLRLEYRLLPRARSLFDIPASTLPLALHPNRANLCFTAGDFDGDLWRHIFSFFSVDDRATLRALRTSCISLAIIVHSMKPEITGFFFCVCKEK